MGIRECSVKKICLKSPGFANGSFPDASSVRQYFLGELLRWCCKTNNYIYFRGCVADSTSLWCSIFHPSPFSYAVRPVQFPVHPVAGFCNANPFSDQLPVRFHTMVNFPSFYSYLLGHIRPEDRIDITILSRRTELNVYSDRDYRHHFPPNLISISLLR
jgi:hypothetical protein